MGRGKFLRSLKQRWWLLALLVLPVTIGTLIYTVWRPSQYEAFMTLADRREVDVNLPVIYQEQLFSRGVNEQEIRVLNLANTISSPSVLKSAYDELRARGVIEGSSSEDERRFFNSVSVSPLRGTEYLTVSYVGDKAEDAKLVISTIRDKFMDRFRHLNSSIARQRVQFIEDQLREARQTLQARLQDQKEFQEQHPGAVAYEFSTSNLMNRFSQAKDRLAVAERNQAAAEGQFRMAQLQRNRPEIIQQIDTRQKSLNPAHLEIQSRLSQSRALLESYRQRYGERHPTILTIKAQIAEDEAVLANTDQYVLTSITPEMSEPERVRLLSELEAERALMAARQERANAIRSVAEAQAQIDRLPVLQKEITMYTAEVTALANGVQNLQARAEEAKVREEQNLNPTIYMLDDPQWREVPRNTVLKTMIALFLSLIVAVSLIASLGQVDQGTYTPMEAENSLGFPVLAVLPRSGQQRLSTGAEEATALAASYQILSTQIMSVKEKLVGPGIVVAAAEPDAGRSTIAANLAISLARDGARVLLIDADLRSPSLHEHFGLENRAGLSEVLEGGASVESVVQPTGVDGLLFIAAGQTPVNPVRLFRSESMDDFIELVSKGADYIVFDSPAGSTFGDASVLAANVQNVVLVHEAGKAPSVAEYEFHKSLERLGVNVIGLVLNKARADDCPAYQHFRRNYEATLGRRRMLAGPAALGAGDKPVRERPQQYGAPRDDDEEE